MSDFNVSRATEILAVCGLGAVARYLLSEGEFSMRLLLANIVLAGFIGWGAVLLAEWKDWHSGMIGPVAGALCYLGPTAVTLFARRLVSSATQFPDDRTSTSDEKE